MKPIHSLMKLHLSLPVAGLALFFLSHANAQQQNQTEYLRAIPVESPTPGAATETTEPPVTVKAAVPAHVDTNDIARFIAGLPVTSGPLAGLEQTSEWINYASSMNSRWARFDAGRLQPIRTWVPQELQRVSASRLFYPFSGPDYIYAATMFPQANTYVLCGLEPVGDLPVWEKLQPLEASLGWLQASIKTLIDAGYFVTKDMRVELKMSPLQGTLPLMCVMLARHGDRITSVKRDSSHAEIHFVPAAGGSEKTLFYFSADLSNSGFGRRSSLLGFLRQVHPDAVYVKSASYLMHEQEFSAVRNYILSECSTIVQDDSGIPLRYFDTRRWRLKLYGTYTAPLDIFAKYYQQDLADLYAKSHAAPLTFGAGYHWNPKTATLIVATAREGVRSEQPAPAPVSPSKTRR